MHAIKFKAHIKNGRIDVPEAYQYLESRTIEVIVLCTEKIPAISNSESLLSADHEFVSDEELHKNWKKFASEALR